MRFIIPRIVASEGVYRHCRDVIGIKRGQLRGKIIHFLKPQAGRSSAQLDYCGCVYNSCRYAMVSRIRSRSATVCGWASRWTWCMYKLDDWPLTIDHQQQHQQW